MTNGSHSVPAAARVVDALLGSLVAFIAIAFAALMLADYASNPGALWHGVHHDRNGHFDFGLNLALALRSLDLIEFVKGWLRATVWPPFHGLALASVLLVGGIDVRLAILPSLVGWCCTIVLTWLIARRLFSDRFCGVVAASVAVTFALASPAFRLITGDVMLEGLGAALTALSLYLYLRAMDDYSDVWRWRLLALTLTALFLEKSNYWLLTVAPLAIAALYDNRKTAIEWASAQLARTSVRAIALRAREEPLLIAFVLMVAAIIMILAHGPLTLDIIGKRVSLYPPGHLTTAAWAVLCLRAAIAWARYRTVLDAKIGVAGRELLYWHVVPIAVWFLIPHALSNFLWYVGPTHHGSSNGYHPLLALHDQWVGFSRGFHVAPWAAILAVGLSAMAVAQMRALTAGARPVVILAILSAAAVVLHPQQQLRFQTTWLFAVWVLAGAGSAIVLAWLTSRWPLFMRLIVAGTAVGALAAAEAHQTLSPLIYQASIRSRSGVSDLAFSDAYLPHLADTRNVGFVATFGRTGFFQWTVRERCRCLAVIDMPWLPQIGSREEALAIGAVWLAATSANRIVVVDAPDYESDPRQRYDHLIGLVDAMESQSRFRKVASEVLAPFHATITIWQRR